MFIVVQFPLIDTRKFISVPTNELKKPLWPLPIEGQEFVRAFGVVKERFGGGIAEWVGEEKFSNAANAIAFPSLLHKKEIGSPENPLNPICIFRRFFADGKATCRVKIGFKDKAIDDTNDQCHNPKIDLMAIINDLMSMPVRIPKGSKNKEEYEFQDAGRLLAKHYLDSTTRIVNKKLKKTEKWWVAAGQPIMLLELQSNKKIIPLSRFKQRYFDISIKGLNLSYLSYRRKNKACGVWILEKSPEIEVDKDYLRRLRLHILRLHAERESVKHILRNILLKKINIERNSQATEDLQLFLVNSIRLLNKKSRYGIPQSEILKSVIDLDRIVNEGEFTSLMAELNKVRKNVKENIKRYIFSSQKEFQNVPPAKKIFISYNHNDIQFVKKLKRQLEKADIHIIIDIDSMKFGDNIQEFIERSIDESDFTISIISENSLKSAWVIQEALETLNVEKVNKSKKYIPVFIDDCFLKDEFQSKTVKAIEKSIDKITVEINELSKKYLPTSNLDGKKNRLILLRNNIDKILKKLVESLVCDMSTDEKFNQNLPRLIDLIT